MTLCPSKLSESIRCELPRGHNGKCRHSIELEQPDNYDVIEVEWEFKCTHRTNESR